MSIPPTSNTRTWVLLIGFLYLLLAAVAGIGTGFQEMVGGQEGAAVWFAFASNPLASLMVGIIATAMLQSSSTTTSIIVGLVAGGMPLDAAVPMVMGANIGTTVTNTIVSLGQINRRNSFTRALEAATVHDFFNYLAVLIFLPLELATHVLSRLAQQIGGMLTGEHITQPAVLGYFKSITKVPFSAAEEGLLSLGMDGFWVGALLTAGGVVLIVFAITATSRLLREVMSDRAHDRLLVVLGGGSLHGIFTGAAITVMVQSSSTTTSLMVPLASSGKFTLRDIYPFTLGANIGTTITALLAAISVSGPLANLALQIALVHLFFNLAAVSLIYSTPLLRSIPLALATRFAVIATEHKSLAIIYLLLAFLGIPALLIYLTN